MPQMAPMNWLILFIYFLLIMFIFMNTFYFNFNKSIKFKFNKFKMIKNYNKLI
uniref:ATP synthase complex subunit 8 n=1 Tax=Tetraneura radicicola TaxID=1308604 RepID=A0A096VKA1_9HEMI|nr:ATP synthase F0 subunit 8 [Tetraneura radicicola]AHK17968.1 F-ATPase subunit 8 [Tetraneura radicicola]